MSCKPQILLKLQSLPRTFPSGVSNRLFNSRYLGKGKGVEGNESFEFVSQPNTVERTDSSGIAKIGGS